MKWSFLLVVSFMIAFISCGEKKKVIDPKFDDSLYERVDENFFKSKTTGKFYIHTSMLTTVKDSGNRVVFYYKEVPTVDTSSFVRLDQGGFYAKDNKQVYTWDVTSNGEDITVLSGADPATFRVLGYEWAADTNKVYRRAQVMKGLDPSTLKIVCAESEDSSTIYIDYIRDNDQLFYKEQEVKIPEGIELQKLTCVEDLFGNPFVSYKDHLYVVRNGALVVHQ